MLLCAISAFLTVAVHAALPEARQAWTPELQAMVKVPSAVQLSPDGTRIAYSVSEAVMTANRSEYVSQIHVASTDGKSHLQLTSGDASSTNAKWSPDGKSIAYLSRRNGRYNIFVHALASGQARQLSDFQTGVVGFAWSPDSRRVALVANDGETTQEEQDAKGRNDAYWLDEAHKMGRLYLLDVEAGSAAAPRQLTDGKRHVTGEFDWSPDGRRIAFTHEETPAIDRWKSAQVSVAHVQNGLITNLAPTVTGLSQPHFSPDGRWIAVRASHRPARYPDGADIVLLASDGGQTKTLPLTLNADPTIVRWSSDSKHLYFSEAKGTRTDTNYIDIEQGQIVALQQEAAALSALDVSNDGRTLAFVMQTTHTAPEVYTSATTPFAPVRISDVNADTLQRGVGKTELIRWKSRDGTEIEGLLTYPMGYVAGTRVPLLLNIHGGPDSLFSQNYIAGRGNFPIASLSARGYAVLRANPRGSGGYGTAFRVRHLQLWGGEDYYDLMSGVDHVISLGVANPDRLGVIGWSYGGYMTNWIVSHTDRFKVAIAGAAVTNLLSFVNTTDMRDLIPDYLEMRHWEGAETYASRSPIGYVANVKTPTLIIHGEADPRVPVAQGLELFYALRQRSVPTRMLVLPRQPHNPVEPKMSLAVSRAGLEWIERYLPIAR